MPYPALLRDTKYILTLDADTRLLPGAARELIGAMLHPLNRPVFGPGRVVVSGHGLIHPRMGVELSSAVKTPFSRLMAGAGGTDPYGGACGEVWMDLSSRRRSTGSPAAGRINCALHSFRNKKGIASCQREIMPSGMHVEPEELDTFLLILCNSDLDAVKREIKKRLG